MSVKNENNAAAFVYKSVRISMLQGKYAGKKPLEIGELVFGFTYYEDITKPFISANLNINDSGSNLIGSGSGPITGGELVEIDVEGPDNKDYSYKFKVYRVGDRINSGKIQNYNLGLISAEALDDPQTRIKKTLSGRPDEIVRQVLNEEGLNTAKQYIADPCDNYKTIIPKNLTPFAICAKLQDQSIPTGAGGKGDGEGAETVDGKYSEGTAGFFFFENFNGYNFRSIDSLMDLKGKMGLNNAGQDSTVKTFQDSAGLELDTTLLDVHFTSEINLMQGLRTGAYALRCQYYNFSTGDYDESTYSAAKSWSKLAHLGSQDGLTPGQQSLAKRPTRIVSAILDDESYYSGQDAAANDLAFKDRTPETLPQAISRNYLLNTQGLRVVVPGNLQLVVGNVVRVNLQNMSTQSDREIESVDQEHSGFYLVTALSRSYSTIDKRVTTMLSLKRDSYGILET
tara:strand:- start:57 stop:1421 length:1365 start_codon:yes stop_codon:yes gene_type:complete